LPDGTPIAPGSGITVDTDEVTYVLTGTVAKTASSPTITGTGTAFTSQLRAGDEIVVPGTANERLVVQSITSDTSLTTTTNAANTATGQTASRVAQRQVTQGGTASTATLTNVASSATSVNVVAANSQRIGCIIYNDSIQGLLIKYGATASATSFTYRIGPGETWEMPTPIWVGQIDGIWDAANGNARVTDLSP
jgi:hypothetical protein